MLNLIFVIVIIVALAAWYGMIYDAMKNQPQSEKYKWLFLLVVFNFIAAIACYITEYRPRNKK